MQDIKTTKGKKLFNKLGTYKKSQHKRKFKTYFDILEKIDFFK